MKSLVLYESKYGNTHKIADTIAEVISAEIACVSDFKPAMLAGIDLLVVGSPIHGWQPSEETVRFLAHLEKNSLKGIYVATFDTGFKTRLSGNAAARIMKKLELAGGTELISTHKFVILQMEGPLAPDEIDQAKNWASLLITQFEQTARPVDHSVR